MRTVHVELGPRSYPILVGPGLLSQASEHFKEKGIGTRVFLVTNTTVYSLHGETLAGSLSSHGFKITEIFIPDGEKFKNMHTVENIYTYLIAQRADRHSVIAAFGGGVTGDIAGFVAATYLRGVSLVQIPTTLLAQVDSSVGGKTGVNHPHGKNMIGVFHQPKLVYIDTATLGSLPDREFRSGLYEVLKYGLIYDREFFDFLETSLPDILKKEPDVLEQVIGRCCEIKAEITSRDEREAGLRRILNFGHTFGHALEVAGEFRQLTHGEAVAYGMLAAGELSARLGYLDRSDCERISRVMGSVGELPPIDHISVVDVLEAMELDKKRESGQKIFVLLKSLGQTEIRGEIEDRLLVDVWKNSVPRMARVKKSV